MKTLRMTAELWPERRPPGSAHSLTYDNSGIHGSQPRVSKGRPAVQDEGVVSPRLHSSGPTPTRAQWTPGESLDRTACFSLHGTPPPGLSTR